LRLKEIAHGLTLARPTEGYVRSAGVHASDLYGAFYRDHDPARYDKKDAKGEAIPMDLTKLEMGTSFEEVLEPAIRLRLFGDRPGEFTSPEGVIYSPDYLFEEPDGDLVLGEFKLTWYSMRGAPTDKKFAKWWSQIKLYCHWLGLRRARLFVLFVNGDYTPPSPSLRAWEAVFTTQELQDEFDMIARHARRKGLLAA
jgi:hypothetical protein